MSLIDDRPRLTGPSWQVPDGYARTESYLRCLRCASMLRHMADDVRDHNQFHVWVDRAVEVVNNQLRGVTG